MQKYTEIPGSANISDSLSLLLNNTKTALSCSSGSAFPTTNLFPGRLCYREDENKLYQIRSVDTSGNPVWKMIFDLNKVTAYAQDVQAVQTSLDNHVSDTTNPHEVTAAQLGAPQKSEVVLRDGSQAMQADLDFGGHRILNCPDVGANIDADKVDGLHASQFLRSDTDDTVSGNLIFNGSDRGKSTVGNYSPEHLQQIWSMGTSFRINADGKDANNLYGMNYSYEPDHNGTGNNPGAVSGLGHQLHWRQNGVVKTAVGSGIWTSGDITAYSDIRVKTDINPIENALEKVLNLKGVTYRRTDQDDDGYHIGFIAQWVEEVEPLLVHTNADVDQHKSVRYQNSTALLVEAMKEMYSHFTSRIDDLEAQLAAKG